MTCCALVFSVMLGASAAIARTPERPPFPDWLRDFKSDAVAFGISTAVVETELANVAPDFSLPDLVRNGEKPRGQAEFTRAPQDYLNRRYLARLATEGRALLAKHRDLLKRIEARLGVPAAMVLAIWGRETAFGRAKLRHDAIRALVTQAYAGRRPDLFRRELLFALKMIDQGIAPREKLRASWAGAIGLTQFMPSEVFQTAIDFDGDGKKDLWSITDALASAANQLRHKGWLSDRPWGIEVTLSEQVDCALAGPTNMRTIGAWAQLGLKRADGRPFTARQKRWPAYLLVPGGTYGPVFLVTENYIVIRRYNMSDLYALFVANLANRIAGKGDFRTPWAKLRQLPTAHLREIQERLKRAGMGITKIDGKLGSNTRSQIGLYQREAGLKRDCWPTGSLLQHLRQKEGGQ